MNAKSMFLLALLVISTSALRFKRDEVIVVEPEAEVGLGEDSPAIFEEGSGMDEDHSHHEHHEFPEVEASGASLTSASEDDTTEASVITAGTAVVADKPVEAATVVSVEEKSEEPASEEVASSSVAAPVQEPSSSESPVSSASSFVTSLFMFIAVYVLVL